MSLEEVMRNKKLLKIAAELAGKGVGKTPSVLGGYGTDEQENIAPNARQAEAETPEVPVTEEIVDYIIEKVKTIEESNGSELTDKDLDFAIKTIIEGLVSDD